MSDEYAEPASFHRAPSDARIRTETDNARLTLAISQRPLRKRQRVVAKVREANQRRERGAHAPVTREDYRRDVAPALEALKLTDAVRATGLSKASCSRIRRGLSVPHPRHWENLAVLGTNRSLMLGKV